MGECARQRFDARSTRDRASYVLLRSGRYRSVRTERNSGAIGDRLRIVRVVARHRFHGADTRFAVTAEFIADRFSDVAFVADVAGGQGMLSRLLAKRHNINSEVVDPRGWTLKGVDVRAAEYTSELADYYDLVVGLHPDEALREVVLSAEAVPVLVVPCCNFWDRSVRLGRESLIGAIRTHHATTGGAVEDVILNFAGPMNRGLILLPPSKPG
jgi:hypothetical protein